MARGRSVTVKTLFAFDADDASFIRDAVVRLAATVDAEPADRAECAAALGCAQSDWRRAAALSASGRGASAYPDVEQQWR